IVAGLSPVRVNSSERVVSHVSVQIPALRVILLLISERFIRAGESTLCAGIVPGNEVIQIRLSVSLLPSKLLSDRIHPIPADAPPAALLPERQIIMPRHPTQAPAGVGYDPRRPQVIPHQPLDATPFRHDQQLP